MMTIRTVARLLVVFGATACSSGAGGGSGGGTGGTGGGGGGAGGSGGGAATSNAGVITLTQRRYGAEFSRQLEARFQLGQLPPAVTRTGCTVSASGSCTITACDGGEFIIPDAGERASAGPLDARLDGASLLTGVAADTRGYYLDSSTGAAWSGGESVQITAAGADGGTVERLLASDDSVGLSHA